MVKPVEVKALNKYLIWVKFEDGTAGKIDLSDSKGIGIFKLWDENDNFSKVFINKETYGIAWNDELEICPETLYDQIKSETKISV
jgi:hypothetical protein